MMRNLIKVLSVCTLLTTLVAYAETESTMRPIGGVDGLSFGQAPHQVDWLIAANWMQSGCSHERIYYLADVDRRNFLAGVRLVWPGLLYRFLDSQLYAIQADFPPSAGAFARLQAHLTREYGAPSMSASWQSAPADTYVYRHRLSSMGWHGAKGSRSIWLTEHTQGGSIIMIDSEIADLGIQRIGEQCASDRTDVAAAAANPTSRSLAKE